MANYGMKISKVGFNVLSADVKDQIFNSTANSFKIIQTGSASATVQQSSIGPPLYIGETIEVSHNLGYIPGFLVFCEFDNDGRWYLLYSFDLFGGFGDATKGRVDSSKLYVWFSAHGGSSYTATIKYYLFVDPGA